MSLAKDDQALGTVSRDNRLSLTTVAFCQWLEHHHVPLSRPASSSGSNTIDAASTLATTLLQDATHNISTDADSEGTSTKPNDELAANWPPTMSHFQACLTPIAGQAVALCDATRTGADTSRATPVQLSETMLLKPRIEPSDPITWMSRRKWLLTFLVGFTMFNGSFASTAPNGAGIAIVKRFGLLPEELTLISSSFVGGCVAGPILWAPLSETYGRRPAFLISNWLYSLTNIGCALAPTKAVLFTFRFLAGVSASCAFSNAVAVVTDLFAPPHRTLPMIVMSLAPLLGPCFGPLFGSLISSLLHWPFVFWLMGALGLALQAALWLLPETYAPAISADIEPKETIASPFMTRRQRFRAFLVSNLIRPINMMCREPIVMCATFYLSFFFAFMYMFFASWPLIFGPPGIYKLDAVHTGITFLPIGFGGVCASVWLAYRERYCGRASAPPARANPEVKLFPTFYVAPLVAAGLLWAGWLARTSIPYPVTMLGGVPIGMAMVLVFQGWIGYLGDCYRLYASSAIASTVIGRAISGATIPLCTHRLHEKLGGIGWLYTLVAGLVLLTTPIPVLIDRFGERLRARSMYKPGSG